MPEIQHTKIHSYKLQNENPWRPLFPSPSLNPHIRQHTSITISEFPTLVYSNYPYMMWKMTWGLWRKWKEYFMDCRKFSRSIFSSIMSVTWIVHKQCDEPTKHLNPNTIQTTPTQLHTPFIASDFRIQVSRTTGKTMLYGPKLCKIR